MTPAKRSALAWTGALAAVGLGALLTWRICVTSLAAIGPTPPPVAPPQPRGDEPDQVGEGRDVVFKYFEEKTGRLVLTVKAGTARTVGAKCELEGVELERKLGEGRGLLVASARRGVYDRVSGNGRLEEDVVARRIPPGATEADTVLRTQELSWDQHSGRMTSAARVEVEWNDPRGGRSATASGLGMAAETWAQSVLLQQETRVELAGSALPPGMDLGGGRPAGEAGGGRAREPVRTVIESEGPASFSRDVGAGEDLVRFSRNVRARSAAARPGSPETRLSCDDLELHLRPAPASPWGCDGPDLQAASASSSAPLLAPSLSGWLMTALGPTPEARRAAAAAPAQRRGDDALTLDLAVARGAVRITSTHGGAGRPEDVARGERAWYDGAAGIFWLDGRPDEPAEVIRAGRDRMLAERFWYNASTGEAGTAGRNRVRLSVGDD